ncbi:F0F1 ATP synthase subunit A, partial [Salmonella enterica]|uniref:F0F1 ATP synthase subunit A n=2 Tax=Pseudomonadati TaxID=3379134 RepID=UPI0022B65082
MEPIVLFVRDEVAKPNIGHKYAKYMPFLLTIFFLILINNFLGLIPFFPGGANVSGNIAFTMTLAVFVFIVVNLNG